MKTWAAILILSCALFCSCKKDYKINISSTISGRFYDSVNKEGYPNLSLAVNEYQSHFDGYGTDYLLVSQLATGKTDANGNYSIKFTTMGKGNYVCLQWGYTPANVQITNTVANTMLGTNDHTRIITNIGGANTYNASVSKQYYVQLNINVHNNPMPPVFVSISDYNLILGLNSISGQNNDTTIYAPINKRDGAFDLYFSVYSPISQKNLNNPTIIFTPVINADTIKGATYDLYPATFK